MSKQNHNLFDIIVVGGGPAGMMAAGRAGELGARVLLIEKNDRLGKKLSITGGRRCNITNAEFDHHLFLDNFPESKQFLFSPLAQFDVQSTFDFFESRGLPFIIEDRKRAFPKTENAEDVCHVLKQYVNDSENVTVALNTTFEGFITNNNQITGINTSTGPLHANRIILATGGFAAPETGSTGEAVTTLTTLGHTVKDPDPNLAPLRTKTQWVHALSGVALDDIQIRFTQNNKTRIKKRGRLLFTHFGISGPLVINSSFEVKNLLAKGKVQAHIDLFPDMDIGTLDQHILEVFETQKNKDIKNALKHLVPKKLATTLFTFEGMPTPDTPVHSITKPQRRTLIDLLKNLHFNIQGTMGLTWSIIADGGVDPKEVNFKTMQSRLHPNLYLIGDTLNINRPSGGFSLQLCWTTGHIAGTHASTHV